MIQLTAEDASCTEAYLRLEVWTKPSTVVLQRGDSTIATLQLTTTDTLIVDEGLQPNQTYQYSAQLISPIPPVWLDDKFTSQVQLQTMDTTSHDFTWQTFTLGDGSGSSCLYDVAIINDTLAYAVGEVYNNGTPYNVAKWNGREWELMRVMFEYHGSQNYSDLRSVFAFGPDDIWFEAGIHWDGKQFETKPMEIEFPSHVNKLWGSPDIGLYAVGNNGLIAHYDGVRWERIESPASGGTGGTTLDMRDIYGAWNTVTKQWEILAVAGHPGTSNDRKILKITGTNVTSISDAPIAYPIVSIWFKPNRHYYVVGCGIYEKRNLTENIWNDRLYNITTYFSDCVRGNDVNDIYVCGSHGEFLHYNGISWRNYITELGLGSSGCYGSLSTKDDLVIVVGFNYRYGVAVIGRHN